MRREGVKEGRARRAAAEKRESMVGSRFLCSSYAQNSVLVCLDVVVDDAGRRSGHFLALNHRTERRIGGIIGVIW